MKEPMENTFYLFASVCMPISNNFSKLSSWEFFVYQYLGTLENEIPIV